VPGDNAKVAAGAPQHIRQILHTVHAVVLGCLIARDLRGHCPQALSVIEQHGQARAAQRRRGDVAGRVREQDHDDEVRAIRFEGRDRSLNLCARITHAGEGHIGKRREGLGHRATKIRHLVLEVRPDIIQFEHQTEQAHAGLTTGFHTDSCWIPCTAPPGGVQNYEAGASPKSGTAIN